MAKGELGLLSWVRRREGSGLERNRKEAQNVRESVIKKRKEKEGKGNVTLFELEPRKPSRLSTEKWHATV